MFGVSGLRVRGVEVDVDGARVVQAVTTDVTAAVCPSCGVLSTSRKQNRTTRPRDLPYGAGPLHVHWHKRRLGRRETACAQHVHRDHRRVAVGGAAHRPAAPSDGRPEPVGVRGRRQGVSWPTANRAFPRAADTALQEEAPRRRCWDRRDTPRAAGHATGPQAAVLGA